MSNRTDSSTAGYQWQWVSRWQRRLGSVDWLRLSAVVAIGLDAVTTWIILRDESYRELNTVLLAGWNLDPLVVAAYFAGFALVVWTVTHRPGWLSTAVAAYVVTVVGLFGGLNNLVLFVFGAPSLLDVLADTLALSGSTLIFTAIPVGGIAVALGTAWLCDRPLPWVDVALRTVIVGLGYIACLAVLRAVGVSTVGL